MSNIISIRVSDSENEILSNAASVYGCGLSSLIKRLVFEKLEDEYDLNVISEYLQDKENNDLELKDHESVWRELGL